MIQNQLSRYGAISRVVPDLAPGSKLFLVCDSDDTTVGPVNLGAVYPVDNDGVARVYTTIQAAVNAASGSRGDVVGVLPGYDHTLARADSWATAGVQIIGFGNSQNRPTVRYTAITDEVGLGASNMRVSNLRFLAAGDSIGRALDIDSGFSGIRVDNCSFNYNATTNNFVTMLRVGSPHSVIENNRFIAEDTAGAGRGISLKGGAASFSTIKGNYFYGQFDTVGDTTNGAATIAQDTTDTADTNFSGLLIQDNVIVSTDTAVGAAIRFSAGYTIRGVAVNNSIISYDTAGTDTVLLALSGLGHAFNIVAKNDTNEHVVGSFAHNFTDSGYTS